MNDETLPEPDHYCGSGPRFGATVTGYYTAAALREAVKRATRAALEESARACISGDADDCSAAIRKLLEDGQ